MGTFRLIAYSICVSLSNFETNVENKCEFYCPTSDLDISNENLKVFLINNGTVNSVLDDFLGCLNRMNKDFHVIALTETFLKCESDWIDFPGLNAFHSMRTIKKGMWLHYSSRIILRKQYST